MIKNKFGGIQRTHDVALLSHSRSLLSCDRLPSNCNNVLKVLRCPRCEIYYDFPNAYESSILDQMAAAVALL